MLRLTVEVPQARDRTAFAALRDGSRIVASAHAVASATSAYAAIRANPACDPLRPCGHPALGRYRLINQQPTPPEQRADYGKHLLLFEPESGAALEAESFGRLALLAYGGPAGRRTQGGLRLSGEMLDAVVSRLSSDEEMTLELSTLRPRAWWQFWKAPPIPSQALAGDFDTPQPPHDELALMEALLQKTVRRARTHSARDEDIDRRESSYDRSSTRSSGENFQGKGGESGGAGASGRWSEGAGSAGVDSSGRILAAASIVGAAAVVTAMAADAAGDAEGASGDSADADSGAGTATGTAY